MKILICEDEENVLEDLKQKIEYNLKNIIADEAVTVLGFSNIFSLYDYLEKRNDFVDAIFLDIELNDLSGSNGICVAEKIQKEFSDIKIVFCTGYLKYAESIFKVNPVYCIYKPVTDDRLVMVLEKLVDEIEKQRKQFIIVRSGKEIYRIMSDDIIYAEIEGEHVNIHTNDDCICARESLDHMEEMLGSNFVRCHKSYLVNMKKMKKFEATKFVLTDGTEIAVSRRYKSNTKKAIINMFE